MPSIIWMDPKMMYVSYPPSVESIHRAYNSFVGLSYQEKINPCLHQPPINRASIEQGEEARCPPDLFNLRIV